MISLKLVLALWFLYGLYMEAGLFTAVGFTLVFMAIEHINWQLRKSPQHKQNKSAADGKTPNST